MTKNVKFCAIANAINQSIVVSESLDPSKKDSFEREVNSVLNKDGNLTSTQGSKTLKKECSYGILYYRSTNGGKEVYFVLTDPQYSYNRILTFLGEIAKQNQAGLNETKLSNNLYDLLRQFDANESEGDSFAKTRSTIESITSSVKGNVEQVMKNSTQLNDIESRSQTLSQSSRGFLEQSKKLEKQLRDRRLKTYIIIGSILSIFLIAIILYFAL